MPFNKISKIRNTFVASFYQRDRANSYPKHFYYNFYFKSLVHHFDIFCTFCDEKLNKVKWKAFPLFKNDAR